MENSKNRSTVVHAEHACTLKDIGKHYNNRYQYEIVYARVSEEHVYTLRPGIPLSVIEWINANTHSNKWGWHFEQRNNVQYAILSFDDEDDAFWFRLRYDEKDTK